MLSKVIGDEDLIKVNLDTFKTNGFINYYETQYFRTRAHLVGKQLLLSQWQRVSANNLKSERILVLSKNFFLLDFILGHRFNFGRLSKSAEIQSNGN